MSVIPLELRLDAWPARDRTRWLQATTRSKARFVVGDNPADDLADASLAKAAAGYGRWLSFLASSGELDVDEVPGNRVTPERLARYIDDMRARGNRDTTVFGRLQELASVLRILEPGFDPRRVLAPGGAAVHGRLDLSPRPVEVHHPASLFEMGIDMMERAMILSAPRRRQVMLRDGLLFAVLALRPYRLGTIVSAQLGENVWKDDGRWWTNFAPPRVKNKRELTFPLPAALTPWVERYLAVERVELLNGGETQAFWVNWKGKPLRTRGLEKRIRWCSEKRFGPERTFGPHRFRYGVATVGPEIDPDHPTIGAILLGDSYRTADEHYNRAETHQASQRFAETIEEIRAATEPLAASIFGWRDGAETGEDAR
jgi:integrase